MFGKLAWWEIRFYLFSNVSYILFINPRTCLAVWQCQLYFVYKSTIPSTFGYIGGCGGRVGYSVGLYRRPDCPGRVRIPLRKTSLRNFGNSVYPPALPVSFGGDTKSRRSLLSSVYARGSKRSHQSALECVTVVDSTTLREGQL